MSAPVLTEIRLAADPSAWAAAGFVLEGNSIAAGGVRIEFIAGSAGIVDWAMTEVRTTGIDGLPTRPAASVDLPDGSHPNGVTEIDHLVVATPRLARTVACLEREGIALRRLYEGETGTGEERRLAFFRLGQPVLEVVEAAELADGAPARFWGITFTTADIDAAAALLDDRLGRVKDAVQPGRRIATFRREAGLGLPAALISRQP